MFLVKASNQDYMKAFTFKIPTFPKEDHTILNINLDFQSFTLLILLFKEVLIKGINSHLESNFLFKFQLKNNKIK